MRKYLIPLSLAALAAASSSAFAVTASDNFQARITILTSCTVTAADLDFGNVGVINGGETTTASVAVNCSAGTAHSVSFDSAGLVTNYAGTMTGPGGSVTYNAFLSGIGGVGAQNYTINGSLPAQATPAAGSYTDNQTVYVNY
jgi:spore coat protein U-like protein